MTVAAVPGPVHDVQHGVPSRPYFFTFIGADTSDWVQLPPGEVAAGVSGSGSGFAGYVEYSMSDPLGSLGAIPMRASTQGLTGNPPVIDGDIYKSTAAWWWRAVCTVIGAGNAIIGLDPEPH